MAAPATLTINGGNFASPLRYPGGKGRLAPWLGELIVANRLKGGCYVEPYAGGAGAALYLLLQGFVKRIVINDADPAVYAFWSAVVHESEELIDQIQSNAPTMATRELAREILSAPGDYSSSELAFATFFLNRTSRSGILNGGVIGGKAQAGAYKLDARYNQEDLVARIRAIAAQKDRIKVLGMDALELLTKVAPKLPKKSLIYLDPPYYVKGSQLYRNCYEHADHLAVAKAARQLSHPLLITYDDTPEIRKLYRGVKSSLFSLQYSTHKARPTASEVLFYANLTLPMAPCMTRSTRIDLPSRIRRELKRAAA